MKLLTTYQKKKTIDIVSNVEGSSSGEELITLKYCSGYYNGNTIVKTYHVIYDPDTIRSSNVSRIAIRSEYSYITSATLTAYHISDGNVYYYTIDFEHPGPEKIDIIFDSYIINNILLNDELDYTITYLELFIPS